MRLYETMARHAPDLFIHSGDQIYADGPLRPEVALDDGTVWRNVVTEAKQKVAETLDEFRGNFAYNLLDRHARAFNSQVPMIVQWDDHEVMNNWSPGTDLQARPQYTERSIAMLAARAKRAMFEYLPIRSHPDEAERVYRAYEYGPLAEVIVLDQRSYRSANGGNRQASEGPDTRMMGPTQVAWFKQRLLASRATWKIIASDMPLGLIVGNGPRDGVPTFEAWANGPGAPLGRELELADILTFIRDHRIHNVVWVTADVHYAAAHRYDPAVAEFKNFLPFWEFVAGPLHAGTFGAEQARPDVWLHAGLQQRARRPQAQPSAKRGAAVLRDADARSRHTPVDVRPVESGQRQALERRPRRRLATGRSPVRIDTNVVMPMTNDHHSEIS